jgi:hypothetical protein
MYLAWDPSNPNRRHWVFTGASMPFDEDRETVADLCNLATIGSVAVAREDRLPAGVSLGTIRRRFLPGRFRCQCRCQRRLAIRAR